VPRELAGEPKAGGGVSWEAEPGWRGNAGACLLRVGVEAALLAGAGLKALAGMRLRLLLGLAAGAGCDCMLSWRLKLSSVCCI
jgi:hypothetical protein